MRSADPFVRGCSDVDREALPKRGKIIEGASRAVWGAGPPGSPVLGVKSTLDRLTLFLIPIGKWSDGTAAAVDEH